MSSANTSDLLRSSAVAAGPSVVGLGRGPRSWTGLVVARDRVLTTSFRVRRRRDPGAPVTLTLAGREHMEAQVLAIDDRLGIALLQAETADVPAARVEFGEVALGTPVVALANPGGQGLRATPGYVASDPRPGIGRLRGTTIEHTALLGHGSGGGPVVDGDGRVLGMNLARLEGGLVHALAFDGAARTVLDAMLAGNHRPPPRLGVALTPPRLARRMRAAVGLPSHPGLLVHRVEEGSAAARAGIRSGDLIATIDGEAVQDAGAIEAALARSAGGAAIDVGLVRGVDQVDVVLQLDRAGDRP